MVVLNPVKCDQCGAIVQPPPTPPFVCEYCGTPLPMPQMPAGHIWLTDDAVTSMLRERLTGIDSTWVFPSVPPKKLKNVRALHAPHLPPDEEVLGLYDGTAFGSAKDGWVITSKRICWKNQMEDAQFLEWHHVDPDEIYADGKKMRLGRAKLETLYGKHDDGLYAWEDALGTIARSARPDLATDYDDDDDKDAPAPKDAGWGGPEVAVGGAAGAGGAASWGGMNAPAAGLAPGAPAWQIPTAAPPGGWYDPNMPELERLPQAPYEVDSGCSVVAVHPAGSLVLAAGSATLQLRYAANGQPYQAFGAPDYVTSAAFSPDGDWLLVGTGERQASLYEVSTGQQRGSSQRMKDSCQQVLWLDQTRFAAGGERGEVWIVDASSMQQLHCLLGPSADWESLGGIAATADGTRLYASLGSRLGCFDTATGQIQWRLDDALENASKIAVSPGGEALVSAGYDGVAFFDARTGKPGARFPFRCPQRVTWPEAGTGMFGRKRRDDEDPEMAWDPTPRFSPLGDTVAVQDHVGNLGFIDVATATMHPTPRDRGRAWIEDIAWFGDSNHVLLGMSDNSLAVWSVRPMVSRLHCEALPQQRYDD